MVGYRSAPSRSGRHGNHIFQFHDRILVGGLKHQWLYLNTLDTVRAVEKLVAFYVKEHNSRLPHSAFCGQTPDEMYFKTGESIPEELEAARQKARQARAETNRKRDCEACELMAASLN